MVRLASVEEDTLIMPTIGRALGLHGVEGSDDTVLAALRDRRMLLVLDNLEQLPTAGIVVSRLLEQCRWLVVLATSRAALRVRGEVEHAVQPLATPSGIGGMADVEAAPAGLLLLTRARAVSPGFGTSPDDAPAGGGALSSAWPACPWPLELAAARARLLSPQLLLERLDDAMARDGAVDLPERQRTMRATLDWSYRLLSEAERALYRRLSVFVGGATLAAVEEVADDLGDVLPLLERLIEHSLVRATSLPDGTVWHSMLEPVHRTPPRCLPPTRPSSLGRATRRSTVSAPARRRCTTKAATRSCGSSGPSATPATSPRLRTTGSPSGRASTPGRWCGTSGSSGGCAVTSGRVERLAEGGPGGWRVTPRTRIRAMLTRRVDGLRARWNRRKRAPAGPWPEQVVVAADRAHSVTPTRRPAKGLLPPGVRRRSSRAPITLPPGHRRSGTRRSRGRFRSSV